MMGDVGQREVEMAAKLRSLFEDAGYKTRDIPRPPEAPGRFEILLPDGKRYRVEAHEVDAGPHATVTDADGTVRPFGRPAFPSETVVTKIEGDRERMTIGPGDVGTVRAEDLVGGSEGAASSR